MPPTMKTMVRGPVKLIGPADRLVSRALLAHLEEAPTDLRALDAAPDALRLLRTLAVGRPALLLADAGMGMTLGNSSMLNSP